MARRTLARPRMSRATKDKTRPRGRVHKHSYAPRGGCKDVMEYRGEEVLISGPAGTGKSRACLEKILMVCLMTRNVRALILRKTLRSLGSTALVTWRNYVVKEAMETGTVVYYGGSSQEAPQYRFKNGSTVTIGGLDNSMRIMSAEYDIVYIQEATEITLDDLEMVKTRLRNWRTGFQQLVMDCNPAGENHWLRLRAVRDGLTWLIESRHEDNPRLFNVDGSLTEQGAAYMRILDNLTGVRHKRLRLGLWVSAEGIIYEEFDPYYHIVSWQFDVDGNRLPLPWDWERYWVIDFGFSHPFVLKCYARDPETDALYMYREIFMTGRTIVEHAKTIMDCVTRTEEIKWYNHLDKVEHVQEEIVWTEPQPTAIICDHDAQARRQFEHSTGLGTQPAVKDVWEGIMAHKDRIQRDGFYLMEDALVELDQSLVDRLMPTCTRDEYSSYVWKLNKDGAIQDEPVKLYDDAVDCDRYMTAWLDLKGRARASQMA